MFAEDPTPDLGAGWSLCESCGAEPASVHVIRIEDGEITHSQLCGSCAEGIAEQKLDEVAGGAELPESLKALLGMLAHQSRGQAPPPPPADLACPVCGTTAADLAEHGLVGCAQCYQIFAEQLAVQIEQPVEPVEHLGKVPSRAGNTEVSLEREVLRLRRMLHELVESERYEEAAGVRDRLAELEADRQEAR